MFSIRDGGMPGLNTPIEVIQGPSNSLFLVDIACDSLNMFSHQTVLFDPDEDVEILGKNDEAADFALDGVDPQRCRVNTSVEFNATATAIVEQLDCQLRLQIDIDPQIQSNTSSSGTQLKTAFIRAQATYKLRSGTGWATGVNT